MVVYRGVLLYGESGSGKSSLVNAGLLPEAIRNNFAPERVRLQARRDREFVVERITTDDQGQSMLPSAFAPDGDTGLRVVLPASEFRERLLEAAKHSYPLLVFDQFEEVITAFEEGRIGERLRQGRELQATVVGVLVEFLGLEDLPVKIVLSFREDYFAKVKRLLKKRPELIDQTLHLGPPETDALDDIIRGPFRQFPNKFERELSPELVGRLVEEVRGRGGLGPVSLSEVQLVCQRLQQSDDPEQLFETREFQGIVEDALYEAISRFPEELRGPALSVLTQMVTGSGVRTVISADDVVERVRHDEPFEEAQIREALRRLEQDTRLVRRESRREIEVYEIVSEFLVPWISSLREWRHQELRESEVIQLRRRQEELARAQRLEQTNHKDNLRTAVRIATSLMIQSRYADLDTYYGAVALLQRLSDSQQPSSVRKAASRGLAAALSMEEGHELYMSESAAETSYISGMEEPLVQSDSRRALIGLPLFFVFAALAGATLGVTNILVAGMPGLPSWEISRIELAVSGAVLAVVWGLVYTFEAIARGNERLNRFAPPFRPYWEGLFFLEQASGWPTNLVLPWVLAYVGSELASWAGIDAGFGFYPVLVLASLAALWLYNEAVYLLI